MKDYTIHLPVFDGPLELLLRLIEKNKIDIYDIPIALLTREYLDSLETMKRLDMEVTSAFLVMAATLLQIKSRMMLPKPCGMRKARKKIRALNSSNACWSTRNSSKSAKYSAIWP